MAIDIVKILSYEYSLFSPNEDVKGMITCKGADGHQILLKFLGPTEPFQLLLRSSTLPLRQVDQTNFSISYILDMRIWPMSSIR